MISILFICHGNICRSPMAEFILKDMVQKQHREHEFYISSAATSAEEIGNPVYPPARRKLEEHGIDASGKYARQLTRKDYEEYDYLIGMDDWNIRNILRITGKDPQHKVYKLLQFAGSEREIADPWYTGNFDVTYADIVEGCQALLKQI